MMTDTSMMPKHPLECRTSPSLCNGCLSLNLGHIFWTGDVGWPSVRLSTSQHPGFRSLVHLRDSALSCDSCRYMCANIETKVRRKIDPRLRNPPTWAEFEHQQLYISATLGNQNVSVDYGMETLREDGRQITDLSVNASSTLRHDSDDKPTWLEPEKVPYREDRMIIISRDPRAQTTINTLRSWLGQCERHEACRLHTGRNLPDRVLDVGTLEGPELKLLETRNKPRITEPYIALSYCWGTDGQFVLQKDNLESLKFTIDEACLPQTLQDVIYLCRQLYVRYVWVDAICIVQDDSGDWEEQSSKMAQIYREAYLTVCASNSSGVHEGFLGVRDPVAALCGFAETDNGNRRQVYLSDEETYIHRLVENSIEDEPLSCRAWALQERILPIRRVFFGQRQMIWQCQTMMTTETSTTQQTPTSLLATPADAQQGQALYDQWRKLVQEFSRCKLTQISDRLPAIAGLANLYCNIAQDTYIAGNWERDLIPSMVWCVLKEAKRVPHRAPSWSWSSVEGAIEYYDFVPRMKTEAQVLSHTQVRTDIPQCAGTTDVHLTLVATAAWARVAPNRLYFETKLRPYRGEAGLHSEEHGFDARFYLELDAPRDPQPDENGQVEILLVILGSYAGKVCGISVTPTTTGSGEAAFRRVGSFEDMNPPESGLLSKFPVLLV